MKVVIRHIYDRDQQLSPGALTMLKVFGFPECHMEIALNVVAMI
jgi:hypothetical protein